MQKALYFFLIFWAVLFIYHNDLWSQGRPYEGPDDPAGDVAAERAGFMTGNRVLLFFRNTTELSDCCGLGYDVSKWPNNYDGTKMHDGIGLLVGARTFVENDSIPVTDSTEIRTRTDLDTLYFIQTSYREHMDTDPTLTIEWGLYPVFGYFNELSETPAMSNSPESWPLQGWPVNSGQFKWPGEWNGRFGRGVMKADLESFFVANDAQDQEYLKPDERVKYYPRPGVKIGDKKSDVTIQKGKPWGGLGVRVESRGFQWSNPSATDAIFWEHNITNTSDYNLPEMVFGFWMDNAVGGEEGIGDDLAFYSKDLNMSYSWDYDFIPVGGGKAPGLLGFAYLESPGLPYDGVDNDNDGIMDEKRDNKATKIVGPTDGIYDVGKFLDYYKLNEQDLHDHWDADEDQDWDDGVDLNGNGTYVHQVNGEWRVEPGEDPGDDLGLDGVGPFDINYNGPDEGECNHKPDFIEGLGSEPDFAATDISESDMLGLTTFHYTSSETILRPTWFYADENLFLNLTDGIFEEFQPVPLNFMEIFGSGTFPLFKGRTERLSMSELHSYDPLAALMADDHSAPALFRLKEVVQVIYETDYRFAQPPHMPTLSATPADGKVILTWDDVADVKTRDPFVNNANDFEGYKLYRASDKKMSDAEVITDGYGTPLLKKPIFQCDIVDRKTGFTNFGLINGVGYFLGQDTGIQHYFIDNTVQNGRTYYYVLVAYDYGLPNVGEGIAPSENTFVIELDESEEIRKISKNVAIVTPHQFAAGYKPPHVDMGAENITFGEGAIEPKVALFDKVKANHIYKMTFHVDTVAYLRNVASVRHRFDQLFTNDGFSVYDVSAGNTLVYQETPSRFSGTNLRMGELDSPSGSNYKYWYINTNNAISGIFDGIQLKISMPAALAEFSPSKSGWVRGSSPMQVMVNPSESAYFPWQYDIVFTGQDSAYASRTTKYNSINAADNSPLGPADVLLGQSFNFYVINKSFPDSSGAFEKLDLIVHDVNRNKEFDLSEDIVLAGHAVQVRNRVYWGGTVFGIHFHNVENKSLMPKPNDVYRVDFNRPFVESDSIRFTVQPEIAMDKEELKRTMDDIKVVPNPYVATNEMEPSVANYQLSQRRRIMFTHLPAQCTIKIFTISGVLVNEIEVNNSVGNRQSGWDLNSASNGTAFWNMKTKEGLDVAAGYYIYYVKSKQTGDEIMGKLAIVE